MSLKGKSEVDFTRLLNKCQQMVEKDMKDKTHTNWRLERYIQALNQRLFELKEVNVCQVNENDLSNYGKRVQFFLRNDLSVVNHWGSLADYRCVYDSGVEKDIRNELFFNTKNELRRRDTPEEKSSGDDLETVIKYQNSIQERVAKEMLQLTHNLKHNCSLSNEIIKKDTENSSYAGFIL
ncbi:unnamed protein product [Oppiella nova]|uniref:Vesicle transport protein USE1 n=1 Tax=Oppiella nova TaxID=334625 RepID=A0A7R9LWY0_9ACAR|nr:unnamed protein product [Oppiella nova]CAG2167788.1 unnamed protein product [Oppiella nova]